MKVTITPFNSSTELIFMPLEKKRTVLIITQKNKLFITEKKKKKQRKCIFQGMPMNKESSAIVNYQLIFTKNNGFFKGG